MKVRKIIVENVELYLGYLEKELCQKGISYVKIDTEIHFLDQIIRFYDFDKDMHAIIKLRFLAIEEEMKERLSSSSKNIFQFQAKTYMPMFNTATENGDVIKLGINYQNRNKVVQKYEATQVNQKLKRYYR